MSIEKTHFRKVFDSPYLSSADITEPTELTILRVVVESDKTKKTKDMFNTMYFVEKEIRKGEPLKPMILNATNSKTMHKFTKQAFIDDWAGYGVTVYVDDNVRFGRETLSGLRLHGRTISAEKPSFITSEQITVVQDLIVAAGKTVDGICAALKIDSLAEITTAKFEHICNRLKKTAGENNA